MDEIQKILNAFSESVGAQIKAAIDDLNARIDALPRQVDYEQRIADLEDAIKSVEAAKDGAPGAPGEPGKPGQDGRDALQIEMLPCIEEEKSYPRGTYAIHNGGVFRAYQKTVGMKGWECVLNGVADLSASVEGKTMTIAMSLSDGTCREVKHTIPQPEYKGIFKRSEKYLTGDSVTYDGSVWIAMTDDPQDQAPGKGQGWRLAVKRGRDGRGLYAIARDAGYTGTEKELLAYIMKGEQPDNVVRLED